MDSIVTEVHQKTTKSVTESNNVDNDHSEKHNIDTNIVKEDHNITDTRSKTDENHEKSDNLSQHKLNLNNNENNEVKEIETEDFNSNNVKTNIPDNEQCDICGQFVYNSDIIYYQGHPQDAVEEFIALTNEKLVLSAGNYFRLLSFLYHKK